MNATQYANRIPELVEAAREVGCDFAAMDSYYSNGDFHSTGNQLVSDLVECWNEQTVDTATLLAYADAGGEC